MVPKVAACDTGLQVNIIPVVGKADCCTVEELAEFKERVREQLLEHNISVYQVRFCTCSLHF